MRYFRLNKARRPNKLGYLVTCICMCLLSCKSYYHNLKPATGDVNCIKAFTPNLTNTLYTAYVDVTKHHFSGILLFKMMPDSSTRIVFTNEMGVKFFDFAFTKNGDFIKYYVLAKMDKKAVVKALRNDLQLVLLHPDLSDARLLKDDTYMYVAVPTAKGNNYYITEQCNKLVRIEKASKRKPVVEVQMPGYTNGTPDSIHIAHKNFTFNIALKRTRR